MPMEFAHRESVVCCPDPQQKSKQSSHRTTGRVLLHKHGLGLVCMLPSHPEHFLDCSEGASNPAFLQFEDNQPCSSSC